jgi:tetratricopeptide (TPR) repeat protein
MQRSRCVPTALLALVLLAAACGPGDPIEEARQLQAQGRFEETIEPLGELLQTRRDDPELYFLYGVALSRSGRPSHAAWPLRRAMESAEWKISAGLQLGATALETGNYDEAVEVTTDVLDEEPDNAAGLLLRTVARIHTRRDYEGALADADHLLDIEPDNQTILTYRAVALLGLERREEAAEAMEQLERSAEDGVVAGPYAATFCGARAKFAEESGELETAERRYRACLEQFPGDGLVLRAAVKFLDAIGKTDEATAAIRNAAEAFPQSRSPRVNLAVRLERFGDLAAAEAVLREATDEADPALAAMAYKDLAGFLSQHQRFAESIDAYERALELAPEVREQLLFRYADTLVVAGEPERALALAEEVSVPAERHLIRGRALLEKGELESALEEFSRALVLWPNQPMGRFYAGVTAERLGEFDRAVEEYRYAIRAGASSPEPRLRLARLLQALGQRQLALTALRHDPSGSALTAEAALLELELLGSLSPEPPLRRPALSDPALRGRAVAAYAAGVRRRAGAAAAARIVLQAKQLDLATPESLPALAGLGEDLCAVGRAEEALELLEGVRERAPGSAELLALHAEAHECAGNASQARAGFARALALDPDLPRALRGLARHAAAAGDAQAALDGFEKAAAAAVAAGLDDSSASLAAAEILAARGDPGQAIDQLEDWLASHPLDARVALHLASLLAESDGGAARARALARRAVRLGAGPDAEALALGLEEG